MKQTKHNSFAKSATALALCSFSLGALAEVVVLKAATIITMDDKNPRAEALAFDKDSGKITAIGALSAVRAAAPNAAVKDLGATVLMPGFIGWRDVQA
jgi:imidazolonepropionase-like amidohydrolase